MDLINKIDVILEKMKLQMHTKSIYSLSQIFLQIVRFDVNNCGYVDINKFENFLSKIGVFLKTQELSELFKYLTTVDDVTHAKFESFIGLFKRDVPLKLQDELIEVFNSIKNSEGKVTVADLLNCCRIDHHLHVSVMHKEPQEAIDNLEMSIKFLVGDKAEMELAEFIELNNNMFYVIPKDHENYFRREMPAMWGMSWYGATK